MKATTFVNRREILRGGRHRIFIGRRVWLLLLLPALLLSGCQTPSGSSGSVGNLGLQDLAGNSVDPFASLPTGTRGLVFLFLRPDCPIANHYSPELQRLAHEYSPAGFAFWLVYPDADIAGPVIALHAREYSLPGTPLRDPQHGLVHRAGATVTPEAAVFRPDGRLVYRGRIDDRYVDFGRERPVPTRRDLELALQAMRDGLPVPGPGGPAVGCYIFEPH